MRAPVSARAGAEITTLEGLSTERQAASDAAGVDRRAGAAVRLLPERADHDRQGAARQDTESDATRRSAQGMAGTLCRCMTYYRIQAAIKRAADRDAHDTLHAPSHDRSPISSSRRRRRRAATSSRPPGSSSSASARLAKRHARRQHRRRGAQARGAVSRSRLPAARLVDRHPRGQHGDVLRRQDRLRPGHRHGLPPDDGRRARHRVRQDDLRHGQHRRHRGSGRLGRIGRASRPTAGRCGASRRKRGACCSRWRSTRLRRAGRRNSPSAPA